MADALRTKQNYVQAGTITEELMYEQEQRWP